MTTVRPEPQHGPPLHQRLQGLGPSMIRRVFDAAPPGCLNMGLGVPDLPVPQAVVEAVLTEVSSGRAPYSPNAGRPDLREAIAESYVAHAARGAAIGSWLQSDRVIVTVGAAEALFVALAGLVGAGDEVLVPDPGFPAYRMIAQVLGAQPRPYRLDAEQGFRVKRSAIANAVTERTRAVVLGSPANPTGVVTPPNELQEIAHLLEERGVPWISDEIYDHYVYDTPFASISAFSRRGIVVSGVSKTANLMGWRCGWLVAPPDTVATLTAVHQAVCSCAPTTGQIAALAALRALAGNARGHDEIQENLKSFRRRRQRAVETASSLDLTHAPADGAFYLFVHVEPYLNEEEDDLAFSLRLLNEQRLIVIPGSAFGPGGRGWVRIAYTTDEIEEGFGRLIEGLGSR